MPRYVLILFLLGSIPILVLSRRSLSQPRSHGFYRLFVFEGLLILILLNAEYWFVNPFSARQILSWFFLVLSAILAIVGFGLLGRQLPSPLLIEHTTTLVTTGAYRYIRHPLYASLLYLGWGAFLKHLSITGVLLTLFISIFATLTALAEERENRQKFGAAYAEYMRHSWRFIPFVF